MLMPSSHRGLTTATALLALASLALFLVVDAAQATGRGVAERALGRAVSSLTEADSLAPAVLPDLQAAAASGSSEPLTLPDFPVQVNLSPEEVAALTTGGLRDTVVERSAAAIYEDGMSAFRVDSTSDSPGLFSASGAVDSGLDFLREKNHTGLRVALGVLVVACAALAAYIAAVGRGYSRLTLIGAAVSATAIPLLALVLVARFVLGLAADGADDYITSELLRLGQDVSWLPVRNGVAFAGLGLAFLLLGLLGTWLERRLRGQSSLTG